VIIAIHPFPSRADMHMMLTPSCVCLKPSACPSAQLAQSILFVFAVTVLSVFDVEKVTINGVVQELKNEFSSGVLVWVPSFRSPSAWRKK
jgi:hypothetical protein